MIEVLVELLFVNYLLIHVIFDHAKISNKMFKISNKGKDKTTRNTRRTYRYLLKYFIRRCSGKKILFINKLIEQKIMI